MGESFVGELQQGLKRCEVCQEPINERALKCIHCSSEQGFMRRRLGLSSTVLSLLVALVTVLTAAIPVIKNAFTPEDLRVTAAFQAADAHSVSVMVSNNGIRAGSVHRPHMTAAFQAADAHSVSVMVSNNGIRAGSVHRPHMTIANPDGTNPDIDLIPFQGRDVIIQSTLMISPAQSEILYFMRTSERLSPADIQSNAICNMWLGSTSFKNVSGQIKLDLDCQQIEPFLTR